MEFCFLTITPLTEADPTIHVTSCIDSLRPLSRISGCESGCPGWWCSTISNYSVSFVKIILFFNNKYSKAAKNIAFIITNFNVQPLSLCDLIGLLSFLTGLLLASILDPIVAFELLSLV